MKLVAYWTSQGGSPSRQSLGVVAIISKRLIVSGVTMMDGHGGIRMKGVTWDSVVRMASPF